MPCAELDRLGLDFLPDLGIACDGPVRSILLVSKRPFGEIRTLAADSGSRTSVALARIVLAERYGCRPAITPCLPRLDDMLAERDAALIIGDPALHLDPEKLPYRTLDLGAEWVGWTGLPMVFAVWAARKGVVTPDVVEAFRGSCRYGLAQMDEIVAKESARLGFAPELVRDYLTRHIVHELGPREYEGMDLFLHYARMKDKASQAV